MNLSRLLSSISRQSHRRNPSIPFSFQLAPFSSKQNLPKKTKKPFSNQDDLTISEPLKTADPTILKDLKRPTEIPFQPRVANKVELIGRIGFPFERQELKGGIAAVSVLVQEKVSKLPQFWIPIIFQGELAEIASSHLKQNETVHIVGQLSGDMPSVKINECQANVQVLAHTLRYVKDDGAEIDVSFMEEKPSPPIPPSPVSFTEDKSKNANTSTVPSWEDLDANPQDWYDNRMDKQNGLKKPRFPDFTHKATKAGLWLNASPELIPKGINDLTLPNSSKSPIQGSAFNADTKANAGPKENLWKDLLENTQDWWDNRTTKNNPRGPDFSKKTTKQGLWLNDAPYWVDEKFSELNFKKSSAFNGNTAQNFNKKSPFNANTDQNIRSKEGLWKDLTDNPNAWYDNRLTKKNLKQPDFKHKVSGEALWISGTTPEWARSKFPSMKSKNGKSYSFVSTNDSDVPTKSSHTTLLS